MNLNVSKCAVGSYTQRQNPIQFAYEMNDINKDGMHTYLTRLHNFDVIVTSTKII